MRTIFLLTALLALISSCNPGKKTEIKSDLAVANLKGNVWKVDKIVHDAGANCVCPAAQKNECNQTVSVYEKNGMLKESADIDEEGKLVMKYIYNYNRKGICTEVSRFRGEEPAGKDLSIITNGKLAGVRVLNSDGLIEKSLKFIYTGTDLTEEQVLDQAGIVSGTNLNVYENGVLASQTEKDNSGNIVTVSRFTRNPNNDVSEYIIDVPKDSTQFKFTFSYEYDDKGNWTKMTQYYNGKIVNVVLRNITYYTSNN